MVFFLIQNVVVYASDMRMAVGERAISLLSAELSLYPPVLLMKFEELFFTSRTKSDNAIAGFKPMKA
jgi:hypothetical protein